VSGYARRRALREVCDLATRGYDVVRLWREVTPAIAAAVPFHITPCFFTIDPASLLATSHFHEGLAEVPALWLVLEYSEDDFNQLSEVARSARGVATLQEATGGNVGRSARYRASMQPLGADQEVITALRTRGGEVWGALGLYRRPGQPPFDAEDLDFLHELSFALAEGVRRALLMTAAVEPEGPEAPGLVVLNERWQVESMTPGVERWLADLPGGDEIDLGRLPPAVLAVAGRARRSATDMAIAGEVAISRVASRSGRWVVLHGAPLLTQASRRVAVIVEPAHPARIAPLLMAAYGLTEREQQISRLVLEGGSTTEIAERLAVSPLTVQQHLKSVFEKTGVHSRRQLVGKVFFSHYEPRLRDNERRVVAGKVVRGEPMELGGGRPAFAPGQAV
jgi:DNA-binding CsgD family transcriptional regulator